VFALRVLLSWDWNTSDFLYDLVWGGVVSGATGTYFVGNFV